MYKRLIASATLILVLVLGAPGGAFASSGGDDGDDGDDGLTNRTDPRGGNIIWEGLCVGASLSLSKTSRQNCERQVGQSKDDDGSDDQHNDDEDDEDELDNHDKGSKSKHHDHGKGRRHKDKDGHTITTTPPETAPTPPQRVEYAALGDSIAAGQGLAALSGTANEQCDRSFNAYPYAVAERFGLEVTHLACSGATMGDLITEQGISGPNPEPQLDAAFAGGTPDVITITAGANDVRWDNFLRKCVARTCGTANDDQVFGSLLAALSIKTQAVLNEIVQRSGGAPPRVILTGYYDPLSDRCAEVEPRLTLDEITWLGAQTESLNHTLQQAVAQHDFVRFVPLDFTGHDICSDDPWVQTPEQRAPFHPTNEGQQAIADMIL